MEIVSSNAFAILSLIKGFFKYNLNITQALDILSHPQAEVSEPLMIECNSPILREEISNVRNESLIVATGQAIKVIFMETNEGPK